jgi:predicted nucleic acid-binding protein
MPYENIDEYTQRASRRGRAGERRPNSDHGRRYGITGAHSKEEGRGVAETERVECPWSEPAGSSKDEKAMNVLVDTSIWIEFFHPRPTLSDDSFKSLSLLLEDDRAVTIYPIRVELLSGRLETGKKKQIRQAVEVMSHIDPDWNERGVWIRIEEMAEIANRKSLSIPGIVDRMILASAETAGASLWTLDRPLANLASLLKIPLFS